MKKAVAGVDAIVINASGCGTTVKDYGAMFADDPAWKEKAEKVSKLARDVSEVMVEIGLAKVTGIDSGRPLTVAYHSACSMQHGQKITAEPKALLAAAGFSVVVGALVALFAILLLRGNRFGRAILGLSLLGDVVSGAYSSVALEDTVRLIGVAQIVGAVLALYLLYGTEKAQRYFD